MSRISVPQANELHWSKLSSSISKIENGTGSSTSEIKTKEHVFGQSVFQTVYGSVYGN